MHPAFCISEGKLRRQTKTDLICSLSNFLFALDFALFSLELLLETQYLLTNFGFISFSELGFSDI